MELNNIDSKHRIAVLIKQLTDLQQQDGAEDKILSVAKILISEIEGSATAITPNIIHQKYSTVIHPVLNPTIIPVANGDIDEILPQEQIIGNAVTDAAEEVHTEEPPVYVTLEQEITSTEELLSPSEETTSAAEASTPAEATIVDQEVIGAVPDEAADPIIVQQPVSTTPSLINEESKDEFIEGKEIPQFNLWETINTTIPTLSRQEDAPTKIASESVSINDKLAEQNNASQELFSTSPIRDLKKAIDINDRYLFINELFRGDEAMYERSIKTINGFRIRPEAEFWIQRELKVKMGWDDQNITVKKFLNLVNRRFS